MGSENERLLSGQERDSQGCSTSLPMDAEDEDAKHQRRFNENAQRLVKWTIWLLLGAVLIGTVLGTVLVSIPMQDSAHAPEPRKSAAMAMLPKSKGGGRLVVWSGKQHRPNTVYDDLYTFDVRARKWRALYTVTIRDRLPTELPSPRWKAVSLSDGKGGLLVFGGDPLDFDGIGRIYLNDLWRLSFQEDPATPYWQQIRYAKGEAPEARRASAGILANLNGTETLVIWSGRNKRNKMLQDVWMASLDGPEIVWDRVLDKVPEDESSLLEEVEEEEESLVEEKGIMDLFRKKKHKKRKKKKKRKRKKDRNFPAPRKGHLALYVESEDRQLMVILGGRDIEQSYDDLWAFDLSSLEWEEWGRDSPEKPSMRNHLGGFVSEELIYIYGGAAGKESNGGKPGITPLGDMWIFNISSQTWEQLIVEDPLPPARYLYSMDTYTVENEDYLDTRFAIFGGATTNKCYLNDLWEYSVAQNKWEQRSKAEAEPSEACRFLED